MKKIILKGLACMLAIAMMTPMVFQYTAPAVAEAAKKEKRTETREEKRFKTEEENYKAVKKHVKVIKKGKKVQKASFAVSKKTLNGIGLTYQIEVKNLSATTARTWYSTNDKVATVDNNGLVTSVNYGTAVIKCVVSDKKKGKSVLSCVIKVRGNQQEAAVTITNKLLKDDMQYMTIGSIYDFNAVIKPEGTAGSISWSVNDPSVASVNADGVVTALKEGLTVLTATATSSSAIVTSGSAIALPTVKSDKVVIKVVSGAAIEAASVQNVALVNDKTLAIKFSTPMKADTLFNSITSVLANTVTIIPAANTSGITAVNPGELKGVLTDDGKTLIVTAANYFYGYYDVKINNQATAVSGAALQDYQKRALLIYLQ